MVSLLISLPLPGDGRALLRRRSPLVQAYLGLDEAYQLLQVLEVAALPAAHVIGEPAPGDDVALAVERFVPDTDDEGVGIVLHRVTSFFFRDDRSPTVE